MSSVVYFPHRCVRNTDLLKRALLLWDHVEVIDPCGWGYRSPSAELDEVAELLLKTHAPSEVEMQAAHDALFQIFGSQVSEPLSTGNMHYEVMDRKFLAATWHMVRDHGGIHRSATDDTTWLMNKTQMLIMMGALADACAGTTKKTITDSTSGAESIGRYWSQKSHGEWDRNPADQTCVLASLSIPCIDLSSVSLGSLMAFRKKEHGTQGHRLTEARHRLSSRIDEQAALLSNPLLSVSDRRDIISDFETWAERDLKGLREELGLAGRSWLTTGGLTAIVTTAMHVILSGNASSLTLSGALAMGTGLTAACGKYRTERNKALDAHVMSYVHLATNQGLEFDLR